MPAVDRTASARSIAVSRSSWISISVKGSALHGRSGQRTIVLSSSYVFKFMVSITFACGKRAYVPILFLRFRAPNSVY
ncbi:uncharacterized protein N7529_001971 [Penicillium soppii]|uniref:uncharacterized protein n=1 Tax=Penicillium soppii TaxID=69789 RepID=UPI002547EBE1|nr:uncharacterized protein N7529_001971 [Penicillium soppii]KAJ5876387.1 hypothetical protein N7529_001971 [Penicillium soppii]